MSKIVLFCLLALGALAVHVFVFSFRYLWYLSPNEYAFVVIGYCLCAFGIIALWVFRPLPVAIGGLGGLALVFPPILRPQSFVGIDFIYCVYMLVAVAALVGATYYRRRMLKRRAA